MGELTPAQRLGKRVRAERALRHWPMREVAAKAGGISASTIMRIEQGFEVEFSNAARIARALDISLDQALTAPAGCEQCDDMPPAGFTCNTCGARGEAP